MTSDTDLPETTSIHPGGPYPQQFGRYLLLERIGAGGMGTVYRAHDEVLDLDVALKVPHATLMEKQIHHDRFLQEARAAVRLVHPNLCRVLDVGVFHGTHYLAMDLVPGRPLSQCPRMSPKAAAELVHTLATALDEAHRHGIVHRDLKPANVLITPDGRPVITDFGLALRLHSQDKRLTEPGTTPGTPYYMAPEQFQQEFGPLGPHTDVWALGIILYELLTGDVPYRSSNAWTLANEVVNQPPPAPSLRVAGLESSLEAVCLKALQKRPEDRYRSMEEFALALADYL